MEPFYSFLVVTYVANFIIGFFGNILVLIYLCDSLKGTNQFNKSLAYILINLALADICTEVFGTVAIVLEYDLVLHPKDQVGDVVCKMLTTHTLTWSFTNVAVLTVVLLAWERYRAVTQFKSKAASSEDNSKCVGYVLGSFWVLGPVAYSPYIPFQKWDKETGGCVEAFPNKWSKYVIVLLDYTIFFLLPLIFFVFAYSSIVMTLEKPAKDMSSRRKNQFSYHKVRGKLTRTTMLIVCGFIGCWSSAYTLYTIQVMASIDSKAMDTAYELSLILAYFASTSHPIIYSFRSRHFRRKIKALFESFSSGDLLQVICKRPRQQVEPALRPYVMKSSEDTIGIQNQVLDGADSEDSKDASFDSTNSKQT